MSSSYLTINETDRDRFARTANFSVGGKTLSTPNFCGLLKATSPDEFQLFMRWRLTHEDEHLGTYTVRLSDIRNLLQPWLDSRNQTTLSGGVVADSLGRFERQNVRFIDPALEYLYYEAFLSRIDSPVLPRIFVVYARECLAHKGRSGYFRWKAARHHRLWQSLDDDSHQLSAMIGEVRDIQLKYGADILMPPVPLATSGRLLDISIRVNQIFREISRHRAECATYFMFPNSALSDKEMIERTLQHIEGDNSKITLLKFKYLDVHKSGAILPRETLRDLMRELVHIKEDNPERLFMLLEGGYHVFPAAASGAFDIVATSLTGMDMDVVRGGKGVFGHWYDPVKMVSRPIEDVARMFQANGQHLPCGCPPCRTITDIENTDPDKWNQVRRLHYLSNMNDQMREMVRSIRERNSELARDKLANSDIPTLKELIPRN